MTYLSLSLHILLLLSQSPFLPLLTLSTFLFLYLLLPLLTYSPPLTTVPFLFSLSLLSSFFSFFLSLFPPLPIFTEIDGRRRVG